MDSISYRDSEILRRSLFRGVFLQIEALPDNDRGQINLEGLLLSFFCGFFLHKIQAEGIAMASKNKLRFFLFEIFNGFYQLVKTSNWYFKAIKLFYIKYKKKMVLVEKYDFVQQG